jgi:hypothetical protein
MDTFLRDLIKDDYKFFDNTRTLKLVHRSTQDVDFDQRKITSFLVEEELEYCLVRQLAERNTAAVRQIFEKGKSITADSYDLVDTIIEVPVKEGRVIDLEDTIQETMPDGSIRKWAIVSMDFATLNTRHRLGCRSL